MYYVNWQRNISIIEIDGKKAILKSNKPTTSLHEYLLITAYTFLSILLCHPAAPPRLGNTIILNEGFEMRRKLERIGISTPSLISISETSIVEDFIDGGNLYQALSNGKDPVLASNVGEITGCLHNAGYVFTDNKSQNYLITSSNKVLRTDLAFIQKENSLYSRSLDIGSFLASVIGLENSKYKDIERAFFKGYRSRTKNSFPYLSIILRNILCLGLSSNLTMFSNMLNLPTKIS